MRHINYDWGRRLSSLAQLEMWKDIFGHDVGLNIPVTNPLRKDKVAGCFLFELRNEVVLSDYNAKNYFSEIIGDYITLYQAIKIKYKFSQEQIYIWMNKFNKFIPDSKSEIIVNKIDNKTYLSFEILKKNNKISYTKKALDYYKTYGISIKDLYNSGAFCVSRYVISKIIGQKREAKVIYPLNELCIGFRLQNNRNKIYYPNRKEFKWVSNTTISNYWFISGNDNLVLTSSHKDALVINKLSGASVLAGMSESVRYTIEQVELIKSYSSIYSLGDGDLAGKAFNERNKELFDSKEIDIEEYASFTNKYGKVCKDISEIYRLDKELAREILCNTMLG